MIDIKYVLCGKCKIFVKGPAEPDAESVFACPKCGTSDTYQNIIAEVAEYQKIQTTKQLQGQLGSIASEHKWMNLTLNPVPEKNFRFVIDLEPST
jgi:hypothetical protein